MNLELFEPESAVERGEARGSGLIALSVHSG
jgi:hypothetical protein